MVEPIKALYIRVPLAAGNMAWRFAGDVIRGVRAVLVAAAIAACLAALGVGAVGVTTGAAKVDSPNPWAIAEQSLEEIASQVKAGVALLGTLADAAGRVDGTPSRRRDVWYRAGETRCAQSCAPSR